MLLVAVKKRQVNAKLCDSPKLFFLLFSSCCSALDSYSIKLAKKNLPKKKVRAF